MVVVCAATVVVVDFLRPQRVSACAGRLAKNEDLPLACARGAPSALGGINFHALSSCTADGRTQFPCPKTSEACCVIVHCVKLVRVAAADQV